MSRAAHPKIDFDRIVLPSAVVSSLAQEIDGEARNRAPVLQHHADPTRVVLNGHPIGRVRGETTPRVDLTVLAFDALIVRGQ